MFTVALETDAAQHDHFVIALYFFEGLSQNGLRILVIALEVFLKSARHAGRRFL